MGYRAMMPTFVGEACSSRCDAARPAAIPQPRQRTGKQMCQYRRRAFTRQGWSGPAAGCRHTLKNGKQQAQAEMVNKVRHEAGCQNSQRHVGPQ